MAMTATMCLFVTVLLVCSYPVLSRRNHHGHHHNRLISRNNNIFAAKQNKIHSFHHLYYDDDNFHGNIYYDDDFEGGPLKEAQTLKAEDVEPKTDVGFKKKLKKEGKFTHWEADEIIHGTNTKILYRATTEYRVKDIDDKKGWKKQGYPHLSTNAVNIFGDGLYFCDSDVPAYFKAMEAGGKGKKWIIKAEVMVGKTKKWDHYQEEPGKETDQDSAWYNLICCEADGYTERKSKKHSYIYWKTKKKVYREMEFPEYLRDILKVDSVHLLQTPRLYRGFDKEAEKGEWFAFYQNQVFPLEAYQVEYDGPGKIKKTGKKYP